MICKILELFVTTMTPNDKYSLLNRRNLFERLMMQSYQKENTFCQVLLAFWIYIQFWTFFKKRWPSGLMYFWTYVLSKSWLDKCLKSPVSEDHLKSNMVNGLKHCWNLTNSTFTIFTDHTMKAIQFEKVTLSDMQSIRTVCSDIDCRWQVFSS